ncbi:phosphoribosylanthranilate isomerase [Ruminococcus sp.]|uniref:phosphoribosylanthranilate isomerase n=1 Tax=Ruminococcus sp. TaxID=41978 RepID=UPI002E7921A6|nr:phosphoribosylanthranilate isomerase [Ruminococcus sp.]MEE1264180.1 phosphoribosylanthranilate isomerase [Ruminococcus sp.]
MTKIKLCGLSRPCDIGVANELKPDYIGFVFAPKSKRYVTPEKAMELKQMLLPEIQSVGVFVNEKPETVVKLLQDGTIDIAQLHGAEDEEYIIQLRQLTDKPIIKAFRIETASDIEKALQSTADYLLLDSGAGTGTVFDWKLIQNIKRPYFLAGGLDADNAAEAVNTLRPYALDVSSGIETSGLKDKSKMAAFVSAVRKEEEK